MSLLSKSDNSVEFNSPANRFELHQIYLLLTRQCNLACSHCIRSSTPYHREMMDVGLALRILEQLHIIRPEATLMISGGEPTLHPQFNKIVAAGLKSFSRVVINSNGLRLTSLLETCLHSAAEIQISIDGDSATHDQIRGDNTFSKTISNINHLAQSGITVTIATTVTKSNFNSLKNLDRILSEIHFARWNVKRVVGSGRASDADDISTSDWNKLVADFKNTTLNANRLSMSFMFSEQGIRAVSNSKTHDDGDVLNLASSNCGTGRSKFYINPNGTVYPCACMENIILGDFKTQSPFEIIQSICDLNIEPASDAVCRICPAWKVCRGGCPGIARRTTAPTLGDPRCPLAAAGRTDAGEIQR